MPLEKLAHPPVIEVIWGILFDELPELDPVLLGVYWDRRRNDYPRHQILPAIGAPDLVLGIGQGYPPARIWLISHDDTQVLQLQNNRFYLNWRDRGVAYPRFSGDDGLMARAQREYDIFADFCLEQVGLRPTPRAIELGKTDHFVRGRDFMSSKDLGDMLPTLQPALSLTTTDSPDVELHVREARDGGTLRVGLRTVVVQGDSGKRDVVLRMETNVNRRLAAPTVDAIAAAFSEANGEANNAFEALIPREQRNQRFQERARP